MMLMMLMKLTTDESTRSDDNCRTGPCFYTNFRGTCGPTVLPGGQHAAAAATAGSWTLLSCLANKCNNCWPSTAGHWLTALTIRPRSAADCPNLDIISSAVLAWISGIRRNALFDGGLTCWNSSEVMSYRWLVSRGRLILNQRQSVYVNTPSISHLEWIVSVSNIDCYLCIIHSVSIK